MKFPLRIITGTVFMRVKYHHPNLTRGKYFLGFGDWAKQDTNLLYGVCKTSSVYPVRLNKYANMVPFK